MKKVLIVDDDPDDRELIKQAIQECIDPVEVSECNDGCYVLEYLESVYPAVPDLILLDLNMPIMNGFEVTELLHSIEKFSSLPIYIFTTSSSVRDRNQSIQLGATDVITKPTIFEHWVKCICGIIDKRDVA